MSDYSIIPISSGDIPVIAAFAHTSKQSLTINRALWKDWPNEAAQKAVYANAVEDSFKDPFAKTFKAINDESGEILGHVVLSRKKPSSVGKETDDNGKEEERLGGETPKGLDPKVAGAVGEAVREIGKELKGIDHFEVTHLFVAMAHRKRGIGSQLVKMCLDKAKSEGVPLAVASEPAVHGFFLKLGFEDAKHFDIDLRKWSPEYCGFGVFRIWGMAMNS